MKPASLNTATKIVCTVGPASRSPDILARMVRSGMDVARINFAHGSREQHAEDISMIRRVSGRLGRPVAVLQDLPGPKLRVGKLSEPMHLRRADTIVLTGRLVDGAGKIPVAFPNLSRSVRGGDTIFLSDGSIEIEVVRVVGEEVHGRVIAGGTVTSGKGVNLPRLRIRMPAMTKNDAAHLRFGLENDVDAVAVSFVQRSEDVLAARRIAEKFGEDVFIVAKVERREAVENLDEIVRVSDGVMVARGDLGVELNLESVPIIQKRIIHEANKLGKPVITATQMLESMVSSPSPTRAEVADVANAIIDGTDAVMLSEETAIGKYPVEAVAMLEKVAEETEKFLPREITSQRLAWREHSQEDALALAACETALQISASAIITPTRTGQTARRVAKYHSRLPIVALTSYEKVQHQLLLSWGVHPVPAKNLTSLESIFKEADRAVRSMGLAKRGDRVVIVAGDPKGPTGRTDLLKIQTLS